MEVVIYGIGTFAKLLYYYFTKDSNYKIVAFCADRIYIKDKNFCNLPLIPFEDLERSYSPEKFKVFVAVGYSNMRARKIMFDKIKSKNYESVNYISSKAILDSNVIVGENNVILENTVIEPFVKIVNNNIIWSSSNICHDVFIDSHSFIAAQTLIGGFSKIKNNCFVGFNSTIIQNIVLENETLVGAKSLVLKNTKSFTKYIGNPAKSVSTHEQEGIKIK